MSKPRSAPPKPDALADAVKNPEKARALLALLEAGDTSKVPPDRLRDWASDLVRTVERQKAGTKARTADTKAPTAALPKARPVGGYTAPPPMPAAPAVAAAPAGTAPETQQAPSQPKRARLFRSPAPTLRTPAAPRAAMPKAPVAPARTASAPASHLPREIEQAAPRVRPTPGPLRGMLTRAEVRAVIATVDSAVLPGEHPAVIAMTLTGKPSLEQARTLRSLPCGKVRAVHSALRQLEKAG